MENDNIQLTTLRIEQYVLQDESRICSVSVITVVHDDSEASTYDGGKDSN